MRPKPAEAAARSVADQPVPHLFTTSVTEAEIGYSLAMMSLGARRGALEAAGERVLSDDFGSRILRFDTLAPLEYPTIAPTLVARAGPSGWGASTATGCQGHASLAVPSCSTHSRG